MHKLKCYYAHTMISYDSTIEQYDIKMLENLNFEVINPFDWVIYNGCREYVKQHGNENVMDYFKDIIDKCDLVAFRALPDGQILSGIAAEVSHARSRQLPIIELPCSLTDRMLDYPKTKEFLTELGFYKTK